MVHTHHQQIQTRPPCRGDGTAAALHPELLLYLLHTADADKTKLSCLVRVGGVNTTGDTTRRFCLVSTLFPSFKFSVVLNIFETEQLQLETGLRQDKTVANCVHTADTDKTKQDKTVLSCPRRRCEQAISRSATVSASFLRLSWPSADCCPGLSSQEAVVRRDPPCTSGFVLCLFHLTLFP